MSNAVAWLRAPIDRRDVVAIPIVWVALLLSLGFHAAMLWFGLPQLPQPLDLAVDEPAPGKARAALVTRLAPPPRKASVSPAAVPPPAVDPPARRSTPPPARRRSPPPPILAANGPPAQPLPSPAPPPVAEPALPRPPLETDLASYVAARRRDRGELPAVAAPTMPAGETAAERRDRIVAANLAPNQPPTFGYDPNSGGGVFELKRIGYDDAEFYFTGWNKEIGRRARNLVEVRTGSHHDIRVAIIRKVIEIIREEVQGDFSWQSQRLGQVVDISARPGDNAQLEAFLMQEFFSAPRRPR